MTGLSPREPGSGHVIRVGARGVFGILAVVVVLSGCARLETSHDTAGTRDGSGGGDAFTRRSGEAYHQIVLRKADSRTLSPVLASRPQGCFYSRTAPREEILRPVPVAAAGDAFHATPQNLRAEMVCPSGPEAATARHPAAAPTSFRLEAHDADNVANGQTAQFALPKPALEGQAPAVQLPKELTFEYVYGSELEIPYVRNADLNSDVSDDSLFVAPTLFGAVTYRPTAWLETRLEMTLEKVVAVHEEKLLTLPDGSIQVPDPNPLSLLIDQVYAKVKLPNVPVEFTLGRRLFEDARLWLFDGELDAAIVTLKPGDFKIEASVSREDLFDLDLFAHVPLGQINNYVVYAEYRGIEDHKLAGYWILRDDELGEEGKPQFMGVRAYGRPSDEFRYWTDLAFLRGKDKLSRDFSGYAFEVGGTYRFPDLPLDPSVTLGYAYGSGDGNPNDNKNHEFRQTGLQSNEARFGGVTQFLVYGETLDPELSNLNIFTAGLGFRPAAGAFVDLIYHRYWLNEIATEVRGSAITAKMNQVDSRLSKDVGDAFDIVLGFRNLFGVRGLGVEVRAGFFFPGDAFLRDDGGVFSDADKGVSVLGVIFY